MTRDEIIEIARKVGVEATGNEYWPFFIEELEAFAKLVAAKEREACAKYLDSQNTAITDMFAAEIRARNND